MKSNKVYLFTAVCYVLASISFLIAAVFHEQALPKVLSGIACALMLIGGIGFLRTYLKNKKTGKD